MPDRHLIIARNHIHLTRGPKEGLHRPSINATFRSAAQTYGPRFIGILFSGMLDDGAAGLWEIAHRGGVTIIQDPAEAQYPSMRQNALRDVDINYKHGAAEIGPVVHRLVSGGEMPEAYLPPRSDNGGEDRFSGITCPECRGPLYEEVLRPGEFHCRVGHVFPLKVLLDEHTSTQERKLYEAMLALEQGAQLADYIAARTAHPQNGLTKEAEQLRRHAATIRNLIEERVVSAVD